MSTRTQSDLVSALVHFNYTVDQLTAVLYWELHGQRLEFKNGQDLGTARQIFSNSCLESSLLSLRILDEFFRSKNPKYNNDIKAEDFLEVGKNRFSQGWNHFLTDDQKDMLDKHLAHLTWKRVENPSPPWFYSVIYSALPMCESFLRYIQLTFLKSTVGVDSQVLKSAQNRVNLQLDGLGKLELFLKDSGLKPAVE